MTPTRVLFVDDDDPLRILVDRHLSAEGYFVSTAMNGNEAMEILTKEMVDLLILDVRMPGMDGLAVLAEMRRRNIKPRIIVLTGADDIDIALTAAKLGANDYMTKPFDLEELADSVRRILQV